MKTLKNTKDEMDELITRIEQREQAIKELIVVYEMLLKEMTKCLPKSSQTKEYRKNKGK